MSKKLSLKLKVLIASGLIAAGVGASYGAVWAYAQNSDEVKGSFPPFSKEALKNNYASIKEEGVLTPQLGILDPLKEKKVADLNEDATEFWFLNKPEERMDLDTFFQKYYEIYQEGFILEVKYASFSFFDEYVLAVRPKQFIDFSKWFMTNVAWGPDILTLESFRIVKGAEQRGNSITLGSHSTDKKESSEIKFFPDAFFGSLPIFSSYSGRGLAPDALTYSTFTKSVDLKTLEEYLNNIPLASAIMNSNHTEYTDSYDTSATRDKRPNLELFQGLLTPGRLIGQKFIVYKNDSPEHLKNITISEKEKVAQGLLLVLPYDITKGEFEDLKKANPKIYDQVQFSDFEPAIIKNVKKQALVDPAGKVTPISMKLDFEFTNDREERSKEFSHYYKEVPETLFDMQSLGVYRNLVESQIVNFLDFYDVNNFVGSELYVYHKDGKNYFYKSWAEAENSLKLNGAGENALYKITKFNKVKVGDDFVLYAHLKNIKNNSENADQSELILQFNSGETRIDKKLEFFQFKQAIGYIGSIKPTTLSAGPENITLKDEKGNPIRGLASRDYQLYTEVYSGLIDILTAKYPHLLKDLNGPHVEQTLNKEGYYTYKVVDGPYKGMSDGDRIGLPLVLNALIENYEGISTDFLKYVGAHEYGHHYTLEGTQSLNNQKNSVVVGGLNTRGGVNVQSYFAYDAVKNYLDARTGLEIVRVDALGNETPNGEFINFKYHKIHSDEVFNETDQDIWGTANKNDDIFDLINNKQRRFLQNYETLNEAAKLRDVKVGDLFIANSFDRHSGTLNPYIEGPMSAFNNASDLGFEKLSTERVLNIVYDGKFQKIPYEVKSNGSVDIKVIETLGKGDQMSISKINVFNSDGTPAINVPLFKVLDHASWDYVNRQVDVIKQSINNLVRANGYDSGWNQPSTILGGKPEFSLVKVLEGEKLTKWADEVKTRKDPIEKNPDYNIYGYTLENKERKGWSYLSLFSDASGNLLNWYLIRQAAYSKNFYDSLDDKLTQYKTYIKDKANTYNGYNAGINPTVYFDETHKYSFPLAKNRNSSPIYNNPDRLKSVAAQYDLPVPSGEVLYGFDYFFIAGLNQKYLGFLTSNNTLSSSPQDELQNLCEC
ncbi:Uncharacterised protein (plasmid) [Mycoplasmopsis gallopavonis]|uniref:PDxFFG protein n=1 Tax=Mycoplasmopsis gallopavonis TaxID=76629 RepID=A0A449B0S4_9BACT|nr:PDxFFG protein [Mycoplasmopsis gallopavonis]VEU73334.1 Uncharacterised protein [Mycoplasmopsis gallopavonis]